MENVPVYYRKADGIETGVQVYFKSFCNDWCDEVRNEVLKYIAYEIGDVIRESFVDEARYVMKNEKNYAMDQFIFQIYYDSDTRTVFLTYDMDKTIRYNFDPRKIIFKINERLNNNFQRVTNRHLRIVNYYHYDMYQNNIKSNRVIAVPITIETFSYWKCHDGLYRFITGKNLLENFHGYHISHHAIELMVHKIGQINSKYNFIKPETNKFNVESAFNELKGLYKKYIGIDLKPIPDNEIYRVYMDCYYPSIEDKLK